jgi:hypothetical protein
MRRGVFVVLLLTIPLLPGCDLLEGLNPAVPQWEALTDDVFENLTTGDLYVKEGTTLKKATLTESREFEGLLPYEWIEVRSNSASLCDEDPEAPRSGTRKCEELSEEATRYYSISRGELHACRFWSRRYADSDADTLAALTRRAEGMDPYTEKVLCDRVTVGVSSSANGDRRRLVIVE